jgi:DNA-binding NtrC family response regulator
VPDAGHPSILIVDDDDMIRSYLSLILRQEDYTIMGEVGDITRAERVLSLKPVSLVFLDINLPGTDGLTALKTLRASYPKTRFIMISSESTSQNVKAAMAEGAKGFVTKPFNAEKVIQAAHRALESRDE